MKKVIEKLKNAVLLLLVFTVAIVVGITDVFAAEPPKTLKVGSSTNLPTYISGLNIPRKILSDGTYSAWVINSPNIVTIKVPEILVNANSVASHEITCENVTARSTGITGNPMWGLTEGILYNVYVKTNGKICISYYNTTTTSITLAERDWKFFINN